MLANFISLSRGIKLYAPLSFARLRGIFLTESLEKRLQDLRDQAKLYADAEAERTYLENFRHSKLAMLMKELDQNKYSTVAAQEREARAHPEYLELLHGLKEATRIAEYNKWLLNIAMRGSSLWQSQEATKRAEIQAYNSQSS